MLRQEFPDLAASLEMPDNDAMANLLAKSINEALTIEEGLELAKMQNMANHIDVSGSGNVNTMSVINR